MSDYPGYIASCVRNPKIKWRQKSIGKYWKETTFDFATTIPRIQRWQIIVQEHWKTTGNSLRSDGITSTKGSWRWNSPQNSWNLTCKNLQPKKTILSHPLSETQTRNGLDDVFDQYITVPNISASDSQELSYAVSCQEPANHKFDILLQDGQLPGAKCPDLAKMAYDVHSMPAMSAECERVFNSAKASYHRPVSSDGRWYYGS